MEKDEFKKLFPKLYSEITSHKSELQIEGVRWHSDTRKDDWAPDVFNYLRRCKDDKEGLEIIDFLEKQGELEKEVADDLRHQIKTRGIRSFGSKIEYGYYEKKFRR